MRADKIAGSPIILPLTLYVDCSNLDCCKRAPRLSNENRPMNANETSKVTIERMWLTMYSPVETVISINMSSWRITKQSD